MSADGHAARGRVNVRRAVPGIGEGSGWAADGGGAAWRTSASSAAEPAVAVPAAAGRRRVRPPNAKRRGARVARRIASALLAVLAAAGVAGAAVWALTITGIIQPLVVVSDSMRPAIAAGDLLLAVRVPVEDLHPGDVVSVARDASHRFVTHRLVTASRDGDGWSLTLRGDANPVDDPESYRVEDTVLKVVLIVPLARAAGAAWADAVNVGLALATAAPSPPPPPSPSPLINPHILGGQRTAVWDNLTCPSGTSSWEVWGSIDNASGHRDLHWSGAGQPPFALSYQWLVTWGHWTVAGTIACYGGWGTLADSGVVSG